MNIYPKAGRSQAKASASLPQGRTPAAILAGTLSIDRGTGSYAHAHGSGLSFSGTIQRSNDAVTVHVSGTVVD